ncbi:unnamed protein product [Fusarium equiseti]|uniref:Uncharacterized protein n=1 Tax=Fusarium equiseti TaxID=61235 RepID=A0A8J2J9W5_FUSEQ|nr:unnamed protein product [Fusarium equiseti]
MNLVKETAQGFRPAGDFAPWPHMLKSKTSVGKGAGWGKERDAHEAGSHPRSLISASLFSNPIQPSHIILRPHDNMVGTVGFVQDTSLTGPWKATFSGGSTHQTVMTFPIGVQPPHLANLFAALKQSQDIAIHAWPGCGALWDLLDNAEPITCTIKPYSGLAYSQQWGGNQRVACLDWCLTKVAH